MRTITNKIINAFESGKPLKVDNSYTDGKALYLFDNKIAEWRGKQLWISNGGHRGTKGETGSNTTRERLNGISGVHVSQIKRQWYLDGKEWDGEWVKVKGVTNSEEDKNEQAMSRLNTVAAVAMMGEIFGETEKEKNDWKKRMLSTVHGLSFPDDFDELPEEERKKRLDGAIEQTESKL